MNFHIEENCWKIEKRFICITKPLADDELCKQFTTAKIARSKKKLKILKYHKSSAITMIAIY